MKTGGQYLYYILIGLISAIMVIFLPMIGTGMSLALLFPTTATGWMLWGTSKAASVGFNLIIFHCFVKQARLNVKDDPRYNEARSILIIEERKEEIPLAPKRYFNGIYGKKGFTIILTTLLGLVGFGPAILTFSLTSFLTQLLVVGLGVTFGIIQMKEVEDYWTDEYYRYAKYIQKQNKEQQKNDLQSSNSNTSTPSL